MFIYRQQTQTSLLGHFFFIYTGVAHVKRQDGATGGRQGKMRARRQEAVEGLELQSNGWASPWHFGPHRAEQCCADLLFHFQLNFAWMNHLQSQSEPDPLFIAANWISAIRKFVSLLVRTVRHLLYFTALSGLSSASRTTVGETDNHTFPDIVAERSWITK